jgi:hypothetical protein
MSRIKKKKGGIVKNHRSTRILRCVMSVAGKKIQKRNFEAAAKLTDTYTHSARNGTLKADDQQ